MYISFINGNINKQKLIPKSSTYNHKWPFCDRNVAVAALHHHLNWKNKFQTLDYISKNIANLFLVVVKCVKTSVSVAKQLHI